MADIAIPVHGDHRTEHILTPDPPDTADRNTLLPRLLAAVAGVVLVGCEQTTPSESNAAADLQAADSLDEIDWQSALADWTGSAIQWPDDLFEHDDAPLESRDIFVALVDDNDRSVHGIVQRIARVSFPRTSDRPADGVSRTMRTSAWTFDSIMQAVGHRESTIAPAQYWSETERLAVGLASAPRESTSATRHWHVLDQTLSHTMLDTTDRSRTDTTCKGAWTLGIGAEWQITISQHACPGGSELPSFNAARTGPLAAQAVGIIDGVRRDLTGVAWMSHVWGTPPETSTAVQLDSLLLTLAGLGTLEIVTTRRSSGRGKPITTVASPDDSVTIPDSVGLDLVWQPDDARQGVWRLTIPALDVDVAVAPIGDAFDSSAATGLDGRLRRTVTTSGSHVGAGFTDLQVEDS